MIETRLESDRLDPEALALRFRKAYRQAGAVASFVGVVRGGNGLTELYLDHYPGMTETSLQAIAQAAEARFSLLGGLFVHRVGSVPAEEPIVLVLTASAHRRAALDALDFIMDHLKTHAVFWKQERFEDGSTRWIEAFASDHARVEAWGGLEQIASRSE